MTMEDGRRNECSDRGRARSLRQRRGRHRPILVPSCDFPNWATAPAQRDAPSEVATGHTTNKFSSVLLILLFDFIFGSLEQTLTSIVLASRV